MELRPPAHCPAISRHRLPASPPIEVFSLSVNVRSREQVPNRRPFVSRNFSRASASSRKADLDKGWGQLRRSAYGYAPISPRLPPVRPTYGLAPARFGSLPVAL